MSRRLKWCAWARALVIVVIMLTTITVLLTASHRRPSTWFLSAAALISFTQSSSLCNERSFFLLILCVFLKRGESCPGSVLRGDVFLRLKNSSHPGPFVGAFFLKKKMQWVRGVLCDHFFVTLANSFAFLVTFQSLSCK